MRANGVIYLLPAWNVPAWAAQGYSVRRYSDCGLLGKLIKATISVRSSMGVKVAGTLSVWVARNMMARFAPTRLRYRRLQPNYKEYWTNDSDAVNSIDSYEAALWFVTRGDECSSCGESPLFLSIFDAPLIIRIHKSAADQH